MGESRQTEGGGKSPAVNETQRFHHVLSDDAAEKFQKLSIELISKKILELNSYKSHLPFYFYSFSNSITGLMSFRLINFHIFLRLADKRFRQPPSSSFRFVRLSSTCGTTAAIADVFRGFNCCRTTRVQLPESESIDLTRTSSLQLSVNLLTKNPVKSQD